MFRDVDVLVRRLMGAAATIGGAAGKGPAADYRTVNMCHLQATQCELQQTVWLQDVLKDGSVIENP